MKVILPLKKNFQWQGEMSLRGVMRRRLNDCHRVDKRLDKKLFKKDCLSWCVAFGKRLYYK